MNTLVFDIETVPDVALGRRLHGLDGLADAQVAKAMFALRRQATGSEFLAHEQHRIVAISCVLRSRDGLRVWSLGELGAPEAELIERFFDGIEKFSPDLVSWNGSGFDLPVLHYRGLLAGVQAPRYWETGDEDTAFRYNNYLGRFHWRHMDLMDVLVGLSEPCPRLAGQHGLPARDCPARSDFPARRCGTPTRPANLVGIRQYCETDVLNTYLIYLRFELMRGPLHPRALRGRG